MTGHLLCKATFTKTWGQWGFETGWHDSIQEQEKLCPMCNDGVENELHALLEFAVKYIVFSCFIKKEKLKLILQCNDEISF